MKNPQVRVVIARHTIAALSGVGYYLWNDTFVERQKDVKISGGFFRYIFGKKNQQGYIM